MLTNIQSGEQGTRVMSAFQSSANVTDNTKLTDVTPTLDTPELERTLTTVTPASNQYIVIDSIVGEVAMNGTAGPAIAQATGRLTTKIIGLDAGAFTTLASDNVATVNILREELNCMDNIFQSGTRTPAYVAPLGQAVSIEFYLYYVINGVATCEALCLRNTVVNYRVVTVPRHIYT